MTRKSTRIDIAQHPSYSPNLAPLDYQLFRSLQSSLNDKKFNNDADIKLHLEQFFTSKEQKFYECDIMILPERWHKVIDNNWQHCIA